MTEPVIRAGSSSEKDPSGTISGRLTGTLCRLTGEEIEIFCAARTEPGVHASCQTVSFKTASPLPVLEIRRELNQYLPQDIAVLQAEEVPGLPCFPEPPFPDLYLPDPYRRRDGCVS